MISPVDLRMASVESPTAWGLTPQALHDCFWAARGVAVARQGESRPLDPSAEQYMLVDPRTLVLFRLRELVDLLSWLRPQVLLLRARNLRERSYKELVVTSPDGRFSHFRREYSNVDSRLTRLALTRDLALAEAWRSCPDTSGGWRDIRRRVRRDAIEAATIDACVYDGDRPEEVAKCLIAMAERWSHPGSVIPNVKRLAPGVWAHHDYKPDPTVCFVGPVWIGAGRSVQPRQTVLGPAVLWDDPASRPPVQPRPVRDIEVRPELPRPIKPAKLNNWQLGYRRVFDIIFSGLILLLTSPLLPIVCLAIWLEDGRPFFFAHRRQTVGGREFPCIKFRSMRKDAERFKAQLLKANQADGPQFYISKDPRLTRVGALIRKLNIDELPQFINVLLGHMSVVGPRPSPHAENQFCPAWREARLSVRPGVTGLWQVMRTRRQGLDFQEWIRYDIEYVERMSWHLDLWIIYKTARMCVCGKPRS